MSHGTAKHETGSTLGRFPQLYPYVLDHIGEVPVQRRLRDDIARMDRSVMMGAPDEAQFLGWLAASIGAKRCIEVGVFRGSTTLALALALPADGKIVGLDISADYAQLGIQAWKDAGVEHKIDFRVGDAVSTLREMAADASQLGTYDLVFIDADKVNYDHYYEASLLLLRKGGVIAIDNVLWGGTVIDAADRDADTVAIRGVTEKVRGDPRVHATMLPIADGCYMVRKL